MPATSYLGSDGFEKQVSPASPLPVNIGSATLSVTADGVEIKNDAGNPIPTIEGLSIPQHDYIGISPSTAPSTGNQTITYKTGGAGGTTVATLTLAFVSGNLASVTKS